MGRLWSKLKRMFSSPQVRVRACTNCLGDGWVIDVGRRQRDFICRSCEGYGYTLLGLSKSKGGWR
jgi:hypothetical protein